MSIVFASASPADSTLVIVAIIGVAAAGLPAWLQYRGLKTRLGKPNGHGDVVTMLEKSLVAQGEIKAELRAHTAQDAENFRAIEQRLADAQVDRDAVKAALEQAQER